MTCLCASHPDLPWVLNLAYKAGGMIRAQFTKPKSNVSFKISTADLVTETDVAVESYLVKHIRERYPDHQFLCEESAKQETVTEHPTWVIDPVDGTMNFVHGVPFVAVSIGFMCHHKILLGVIYNPIMDEMFYATRGNGAWLLAKNCDGNLGPQRLHVAAPKALSENLVATGFSASLIRKGLETGSSGASSVKRHMDELQDLVLRNTRQLMLHCRDLRRTGSCACDMAFVAAGRFDAMAEMFVKEWDVCAGVLIIQEAGGAVMNYDGTSSPVDIGRRHIIGGSCKETATGLASVLEYPSFDLRLYG